MKNKIEIEVHLDQDKIPNKLKWFTEANGTKSKAEESKAIFISIFDKASKDTLKMDLWTKEMQVIEMDRFYYYTLKSMAETYFKSTKNEELANQMMSFVQHFGIKTKILEEPKEDA